jgi:predicted RNA-binding Zn ribbon-like protein
VGTITDEEAETLSQRSVQQPADAKSAHGHAMELRETIYRIFTLTLEGRSQVQKDLAVFNSYLAQALVQSAIVSKEDRFYLEMIGNRSKLDWMLNPIIRSAAELLVSDALGRVKKCADPTCGWLFLDTSRNRSRRWCDMRDCGNRAKASRFYQNKRGAKPEKPSSPAPRSSTETKKGIKRHLL